MIEQAVISEPCHDGVPTATLEVELRRGGYAGRFNPVGYSYPSSRIADRYFANTQADRHVAASRTDIWDAPDTAQEEMVILSLPGLALLDHLPKRQSIVIDRA